MGALSFGSVAAGRLLRSTALLRAAVFEIVILTGHLFLYPTGILPERDQPGTPTGPSPNPSPNPHPGPCPGVGPGADSGASRLAAGGPAAHRPVLLLHGFVDNRSVFTLLRRSLRKHGWTHVQALNYSPLSCDVRTAAALLGRHVEQVCRQTGQRQVDIVGHSLGGLIARYYVQRLGGDARVRTLVTLGTPHSGTRAVPLLTPHPIVRQMRPGSDLMRELAKAAPGCRTHFVAFWSDLDQLMIPVETARIDHPDLTVHNVQVAGIGHLALPVHATVAAGIRQALVGEERSMGAEDAA
ncbi:alpha/beta fold hydrolase [Streptomyces sp. H10-C2]|uniref:esterase/lipase family protein n=1 Tax=unclassified Streptomyces TaxID=2593676 RepID=UPI0024B917AF|nr:MULTISPECIES: alpha/beta fold hydrolase [unclassified Streptomyces]MDJ0340564.1 alpha/beta fold hydrolase [Streptomyces sp. PH10-H1]MDJ0370212.1 alpha/beta fold hydrolase [Streptomyces sp. H10-C2]